MMFDLYRCIVTAMMGNVYDDDDDYQHGRRGRERKIACAHTRTCSHAGVDACPRVLVHARVFVCE